MKRILPLELLSLSVLSVFAGCSHSQPIKAQQYAPMKNHRTFEYELPTVWKAIQDVFREYKVSDQQLHDTQDLRKATEVSLETDWSYSLSREKFVEYTLNDKPKKRYLQTRTRQKVIAKRSMGGTDVLIDVTEEVENLKPNGSSDGYNKASHPDPGRAGDTLDQIEHSILSAAGN
ncbi:MAG: hypothetical protein H7222_13270 [Methylotenera sp.]|nr:hypothetical protein [Oligoflexia bacterium]